MFRRIVDKAVRFSNVTSQRLCSTVSSTPSVGRRGLYMELNQVQVVGNVGLEPEVKPKGHLSFSIGNHRGFANKQGEIVNKTIWLKIIATKQSLISKVKEKVRKGDQVLVLGSISTTRYTDDETNKFEISVFIVADQIYVLKSQSTGSRNEEDVVKSMDIQDDDYLDSKTEELL